MPHNSHTKTLPTFVYNRISCLPNKISCSYTVRTLKPVAHLQQFNTLAKMAKSVAIIKRLLYTDCSRLLAKQLPSNLKGKSKSSQEWLTRQLADPFVERAKMLNYRCRSAFKLLEIDDKYKLLKPGDTVLDCGAAPGSWTQIAVQRTNANGANEQQRKGAVFSIDLLHLHPVPGATIFGGVDFTTTAAQQQLKIALAGRAVNCVLSDMAPNATGVRMLDQESIMDLCYAVLRFSLVMSGRGAHLVVKVWDNGDVPRLEKNLARYYEHVKRVKPQSSRSDSSELFLVARRFRGLQETLKTDDH